MKHGLNAFLRVAWVETMMRLPHLCSLASFSPAPIQASSSRKPDPNRRKPDLLFGYHSNPEYIVISTGEQNAASNLEVESDRLFYNDVVRVSDSVDRLQILDNSNDNIYMD
ncbi:hypothetical protein F8388_020570 [Cannabis sativa]|uniref:Uncharacterized protein n=1 Tax=Cannabis sativa TaxID=3483 RepID=A0A7J6ERA9_CANSA|nr:hypothetical protein F8388_020570 [Cannabis sativa]